MIFSRLGQTLYHSGFRAFANIDFIIEDRTEKIHILECNPRLSSSTIHVFAFPELVAGIKIGGLLLDTFTEKEKDPGKKIKFLEIPKTKFQGSTLDINGFHLTKKGSVIIKKEYSPGVYRLNSKRIVFESPDFRKMRPLGKRFILTSFAGKNEKCAWNTVISSIITNFPIYNLKTGSLNQNGKKILKIIKFA